MVWDLRRALLKKDEFESARLTDFEFREMLRAIRLLAEEANVEARPVLHELADKGVDAAHALLAGNEPAAIERAIGRRGPRRGAKSSPSGDPAPHWLG
jgi:hypothetical protein